MEIPILISTWDVFSFKLKELIETGNGLCSQFQNMTPDDRTSKIQSWFTDVIQHFDNNVKPEKNPYSDDLSNRNYQIGRMLKIASDEKQIFTRLKSTIDNLEYYHRIFSLGDTFKGIEAIEERSDWTLDQICELILTKLLRLNDGLYHSLSNILLLNGISLQHHNEMHQLANMLKNLGYIRFIASQTGVSAQLTVEGRMYVESITKKEKADYSNISGSSDVMNLKIDEIINRLNDLGLGHEVLFDEMQELKDLYVVLDKKNWGQVLKGKLIDLGIDQVISKEVIKEIYCELTKSFFHLP